VRWGNRPDACYTYAVPEKSRDPKNSAPKGQLAQSVQLVKDYANQELTGPLKGAGRWIGAGLAGALAIGIGTAFLALGVLRLLQTETGDTFHGRGMHLLPYLASFLIAVVVGLLAFKRINKDPLNKEKR